MIILKRFSETPAENKNDAAVEAGMIGASGLVGVGAGLATKDLAKKAKGITNKIRYKVTKEELVKDAQGKTRKKVTEMTTRGPKFVKVADKLQPIAEKAEKLAATKGGKIALIGVPTAIIGGTTYISTKKKSKKKD